MAIQQNTCCALPQQHPVFDSYNPSAPEQSRQILAYGFRPAGKRRFSLCINSAFASDQIRSRFQPIWCKPDTSQSHSNVLAFLVWEREFWPLDITAAAYSVIVEMGTLPRRGDLVWIRLDSTRTDDDHAMGELRLARFMAPGQLCEVRGGQIGRHRHPCILGVVIEQKFYTDRPAIVTLQGGAR